MKELSKQIIMTDQQLAAIEMVKCNSISILTGKPGTGKTTTTRAILEWCYKEQIKVIQCAPTGKAAKRMIESTGFHAATIHSTLGTIIDDDGNFDFLHNELNPLYADIVICDEMSMVDNHLFYCLLSAIDPSVTKLLIIGDPEQLPSVGPGEVLRDIIDSKIFPHVDLDIIHRNSGKIVQACASIYNGVPFFPESEINLETDDPINLIHIEINDTEKILSAIEKIVTERMPIRGFDPVWDVQTISPVNSRGELSCDSINSLLQKKLNPNYKLPDESGDKKKFKKTEFFIGDKVIQVKNQKIDDVYGEKTFIVNGDIGKIIDIDNKNFTIEFYEPERKVLISKSENNLLLAYCCTCHRMQGSESPVVIIPVHNSFAYFTTRKWIYTAISRAKTICITVGHFTSIKKMIANVNENKRVTMLKYRIEKNLF